MIVWIVDCFPDFNRGVKGVRLWRGDKISVRGDKGGGREGLVTNVGSNGTVNGILSFEIMLGVRVRLSGYERGMVSVVVGVVVILNGREVWLTIG